MQTYTQQAELVEPQEEPPMDPRNPYGQGYIQGDQQYEEGEMFQRPNDLRVIQEYNREENMPSAAKKDFWSMASKSIKLGFWKEDDYREIFLHKNLIKVGHIMSNPRHSYNFKDRQMMNHMDFLVFADFKRGVGMEKYKLNERTLQATSVQQHIQGGGAPGGRKGGILGGLKSFFG